MTFLLDTVTLSELRKGRRADPQVLDWQSRHPGLHRVSVITMNEIRFGIHQVAGKDPEFAERLQIWYAEILKAADLISILPVTLPVAELAATFRHQHKMGYDDSLIAATAHVHGTPLATRNLAGFSATGIKLINPWQVPRS